jgi:SAM-dependent methyltransferase
MSESNTKVFGMYSEYYDLLYKEKDYSAEADYIISLLKDYSPEARSIIDLGCGTGKHAIEFALRDYKVTGVEMSESMLKLAEENLKRRGLISGKVNFLQGDITKIDTGEKYDAAFALFHVMGYLTSNKVLIQGIKNIVRHLKKGGILIFDYWYGPAVLTQRPEKRDKLLEGHGLKIKRKAIPEVFINDNIVEVNYHIEAESESNGEKLELEEKHSMRYFFIPEIKLLLEQNGFEVLKIEEWMTGKELSENSWCGVCAAKFKGDNL